MESFENDVLPELRLWEYFVVNVEQTLKEFIQKVCVGVCVCVKVDSVCWRSLRW